MILLRGWMRNSFLLSGIGALLFSTLPAQAWASTPLSDVWTASASPKSLKSWSLDELKKLKESSSRERDPSTGKVISWKGPLMSTVVEKTIEDLPGEDKAQVDLIIFQSSTGDKAQVPRWLINKYPVMLAVHDGVLKLVLPWSTRPKIWEEGLPLNRYALKDIVQVEFANYQKIYGSFYLKRRTDPLALRGEKIFVQNCTTCHSAGIEKSARKLASTGHPEMKDAPKLKDRDMRALVSYIDEFKGENPTTVTTSDSLAQGQK